MVLDNLKLVAFDPNILNLSFELSHNRQTDNLSPLNF